MKVLPFFNLGATYHGPHSPTSGMAVRFNRRRDTARFHFWLTQDEIEALRKGTLFIPSSGVIYKNPPLEVEPGQPAYFKTRQLKMEGSNADLVRKVLQQLLMGGPGERIFDKAVVAYEEKERARLEEIRAERERGERAKKLADLAPRMLTALQDIVLKLDAGTSPLPSDEFWNEAREIVKEAK